MTLQQNKLFIFGMITSTIVPDYNKFHEIMALFRCCHRKNISIDYETTILNDAMTPIFDYLKETEQCVYDKDTYNLLLLDLVLLVDLNDHVKFTELTKNYYNHAENDADRAVIERGLTKDLEELMKLSDSVASKLQERIEKCS